PGAMLSRRRRVSMQARPRHADPADAVTAWHTLKAMPPCRMGLLGNVHAPGILGRKREWEWLRFGKRERIKQRRRPGCVLGRRRRHRVRGDGHGN
ncbi:MAG: hypothetical protein ACK5Q5_20295, partial [Planctomycetaceae bacterium]